jgi:Protein of unknown function (DUF3363)
MRDHVDFLAAHGLAEWRGQHAVLVNNLLATFSGKDLAATSKTLELQTGRIYRPVQDGEHVGVYRRSIQLTSGRFAVLDDGMNFSLVPCRPAFERWRGREISAIVCGWSASWRIGLEPRLSIYSL